MATLLVAPSTVQLLNIRLPSLTNPKNELNAAVCPRISRLAFIRCFGSLDTQLLRIILDGKHFLLRISTSGSVLYTAFPCFPFCFRWICQHFRVSDVPTSAQTKKFIGNIETRRFIKSDLPPVYFTVLSVFVIFVNSAKYSFIMSLLLDDSAPECGSWENEILFSSLTLCGSFLGDFFSLILWYLREKVVRWSGEKGEGSCPQSATW